MRPMNQQMVVDALRASTEIVFSTMLGMEMESEPPYIETNPVGPSSGMIGLIGFAGAWVGSVSVTCTAAASLRIASRMLGAELTEIGEETLDAMSEITNMIVGGFKSEAETYLGPLGLSIPTVIYGLNFLARSAGKEQWTVVPFLCGDEKIEVRICLTRNRGLPGLRHTGDAQDPAAALICR